MATSSKHVFMTYTLRISGCVDTDNGKTDSTGDGCEHYEHNPSICGRYDDIDFTARLLCCGCGGGSTGTFTLFHLAKYCSFDL